MHHEWNRRRTIENPIPLPGARRQECADFLYRSPYWPERRGFSNATCDLLASAEGQKPAAQCRVKFAIGSWVLLYRDWLGPNAGRRGGPAAWFMDSCPGAEPVVKIRRHRPLAIGPTRNSFQKRPWIFALTENHPSLATGLRARASGFDRCPLAKGLVPDPSRKVRWLFISRSGSGWPEMLRRDPFRTPRQSE